MVWSRLALHMPLELCHAQRYNSGMRDHPLKSYARSHSKTLAEIAAAAGVSRMTIHRVIRGENTTLSLLRRVSAATDGKVSVKQMVADAPEVAA